MPITEFIAHREALASDGPRTCGRKPSPEKRVRILEAAVRLFTTKDYHDKVFRCCKERRDIENKRAELRGFFARLLAEGIAEGSVRMDIEPALCSVVLMGSIRGLLRNFGSTRTSDQLAEQLLSIFIDGAAARPSTGERAQMKPTSQISALDPATLARLDPLASLNELSLGLNLYEDPSMATESNEQDTQGEPGTNRPAGVDGMPGVQST